MAVAKVYKDGEWTQVTGGGSDINFATFSIDPTTGILSATWTMEQSEIVFSLNSSGYLEVTI